MDNEKVSTSKSESATDEVEEMFLSFCGTMMEMAGVGQLVRTTIIFSKCYNIQYGCKDLFCLKGHTKLNMIRTNI